MVKRYRDRTGLSGVMRFVASTLPLLDPTRFKPTHRTRRERSTTVWQRAHLEVDVVSGARRPCARAHTHRMFLSSASAFRTWAQA